MPKKYFYYSRVDSSQEPISTTLASSRLSAAKYFSQRKKLSLKTFLSIYSVSK